MSLNENSFRVNFNVDILSGCKWACAGCYIDKDGQQGFAKGDIERFINLAKSFEDSELIPSIFIVGPTDVFTARNKKEIFFDQDFITLANCFERLAINSTFQEIDEEILRKINSSFQGLEIEIRIVIDVLSFYDDEYLERARTNLDTARAILKDVKAIVVHPQMNLFKTNNLTIQECLGGYQLINDRAYHYFGQGVDYALSFSRSDLEMKKKIAALDWIREKFEIYVNPDTVSNGIHFDASKMTDLSELVFAYRNGEIFYSPGLYDEYVSFDHHFKVPMQKWDVGELIAFKRNKIIQQFEYAKDLPCLECRYVGKCVDKGVLSFLEYASLKRCIFPKSSFDAVNAGGIYFKKKLW